MTDAHSDAELEAMMEDLESDLVEHKESLQGDSPRRIREAVCAFANDLPDRRRSGVVFVGASDDGKPVGLPITDELLLQLDGAVTVENFGQPGGVDYRNPILAEAMRVRCSPADVRPLGGGRGPRQSRDDGPRCIP